MSTETTEAQRAAQAPAGTTEAPEATTEAQEPPETATEEERATYDAAYVRKLRSEAAARRREAKEASERVAALDAEVGEHRAWRLERTIHDVNTGAMGVPSLADPSDLLTFSDPTTLVDDEGKADPERIKAAINVLLERKPHLRAGYGQQGGAWGGSDGGTNPVTPPTLGSLIGKAARGQ